MCRDEGLGARRPLKAAIWWRPPRQQLHDSQQLARHLEFALIASGVKGGHQLVGQPARCRGPSSSHDLAGRRIWNRRRPDVSTAPAGMPVAPAFMVGSRSRLFDDARGCGDCNPDEQQQSDQTRHSVLLFELSIVAPAAWRFCGDLWPNGADPGHDTDTSFRHGVTYRVSLGQGSFADRNDRENGGAPEPWTGSAQPQTGPAMRCTSGVEVTRDRAISFPTACGVVGPDGAVSW